MNIFNFFTRKKYIFHKKLINDIYEKDYIIFLSKYDIKSIFFTKHNILNFYIHDKDKLLEELNSNNNSEKHKIFFYDNNIESNVLYKKIKFSTRDLFVPISIYSIKKMDFKIRTLCQIAEKLGAEFIDISYKNYYLHQDALNSEIKFLNEGLDANNKEVKKDVDNLNIIMSYSRNNQKYNMNLNKYSLFITIDSENELFITKKDYDADIDLQFLVESRCNNFINNYNTNLTVNRFNSYETGILLKAKNIGFKFDLSSLTDETLNISINIKFLNIYDNYTCIDGNNITPSKNSFSVLYGFIMEERSLIENSIVKNKLDNETSKKKVINIYSKIVNYIRVYFKYLSKEFFTLTPSEKKNGLYKNSYNKFNEILLINFTSDELNNLFYKLFYNEYDSYYKFKSIRNKILFGIESHNTIIYSDNKEDRLINKFNFLCYYYNNIEKTKKFIIDNIALYYSKIMFDFIGYTYKLEFYKSIFIDSNLLLYNYAIEMFAEKIDDSLKPNIYFENHSDEIIKKKYEIIKNFYSGTSNDNYNDLLSISSPKIAFLVSMGFETKLFVTTVTNIINPCKELIEIYLEYLKSKTDTYKKISNLLYNNINNRNNEVNTSFTIWKSQKTEFLSYSKKLIEELFNNDTLIIDELNINNNKELIEFSLYNIGMLTKSIDDEKSDLLSLKDIGTKKYMMFSDRQILIDYITYNSISIINSLFKQLHFITILFEKNNKNCCEKLELNDNEKMYNIYHRTSFIIKNIIKKYFENKNININIDDYKIIDIIHNTINSEMFYKNNKKYKVYFTYENIESIVKIIEDKHVTFKKKN